MNELKNLQCIGLTTLGAALKHALDVLNINRMQTGIDTYGQGRCPFFLEPSVIVLITDGGKYTTTSGVQQEFTLPMHSPILGSELTKEPFRWDQRLFSLVLRLSGTPPIERDTGLVASDTSPIDAMCEITGGRSYCVTSHRMMLQCIDSLVQKVQSGVVINFEKIGPDPPLLSTELQAQLNQQEQQQQPSSLLPLAPIDIELDDNDDENSSITINGIKTSQYLPTASVGNTAWHSCRRLIYVPRSPQKGFPVGYWPIPESFWPDLSASSLPPRSAHPNVKFTCTSQEPMVIENLPFDKYELEPSPLTQFILARKQPTTCWQVFVANSYKSSEVGHPFGYLKASTNLTCVNLFVMPYNYPVLLPLLEELFKVHRLKPTSEWRTQFSNYMRTMPTYYAASMKRALTKMGAATPMVQTLIPDTLDNSLSYSVMNYLKKLKNQAKIEYDRLCSEVISKQVATANANKLLINGTTSSITEGVRVIPRIPLKKDLVSHPLLQDKFISLRDQLNEFGGFVVGLVKNQQQQKGAHSYRNAFDVPRKSLLDQVVRMRANFLQPGLSHTKLLDDDYVHSMPVSQMGNYQEHLKKMPPPLREIESVPVRQHMFGNPFKIDKRMMMVDEADMDMVGPSSSSSNTNLNSTAIINNNTSNNSIPTSSILSSNSNTVKGNVKRQVDAIGSPISTRIMPDKRKRGPIPKEVIVRRPTYNNTVRPPSSILSISPSPLPWNQIDNPAPKSPTLPPPEINAFSISHEFSSSSPSALAPPTPPLPASSSTISSSSIITVDSTTFINSITNTISIPDKLTNGLSETRTSSTMVYEPLPVEINDHHHYSDSVQNTSQVTVNNLSLVSKIDNKTNDHSADISEIVHDVCMENQNNIKVEVKNEDRLGNHVEDNKIDGIKNDKDKVFSKKELEEVRKHNLSIRELVYKEVRRRGTSE